MGTTSLSQHGRKPRPLAPQTVMPTPKQDVRSVRLTHRGVVWHSLQFLDNVYIQQLKGQQVLEKEMAK